MRVNVVPSSNHASPTGSLPFLLAPRPSSLHSAEAFASSKLYDYALRHGGKKVLEIDHLQMEAYQALLDGPIRKAYLYALYVDPVSTKLLKELYLEPASSAFLIQAVLQRQLRRAAEAEILKSTPGAATIDPDQIYTEAREAFAALEALLLSSTTQWFWCFDALTLVDASVFAYTGLLMSDPRGSLWPTAHTKPTALHDAIKIAEAVGLDKHQCWLWNVLLPEGTPGVSSEAGHLS